MTPAQRKYDTELAASMRQMAQQFAKRSRKVSDTLKLAADRIDALSSSAPVEPEVKQPASTPAQAKGLTR